MFCHSRPFDAKRSLTFVVLGAAAIACGASPDPNQLDGAPTHHATTHGDVLPGVASTSGSLPTGAMPALDGSGASSGQGEGFALPSVPPYCGDVQYPGGNGNAMTICHPGGSPNVPIVLFVHGGGWVGGGRTDMQPWMLGGVQSGVAVASVDYTDGASMGQIYGEVLSAARTLQASAGVLGFDGGKMGCVGFSAGGHLVLLLATANGTSICKATSSLSGPTNMTDLYLRTSDDIRVDINQVMGRGPASLSDPVYDLASPLFNIHADGNHPGHIQQIFSTSDVIVPPSEGQIFHDAVAPVLAANGLTNDLELVGGGVPIGHGYQLSQIGPLIAEQVGWTVARLR